ncbi:hypothetical protein BGW39_002339 [Mortierella sp. 14UC]|nr:hypothetical protein BGW39_002339 [Mortierella sp. 14UC]
MTSITTGTAGTSPSVLALTQSSNLSTAASACKSNNKNPNTVPSLLYPSYSFYSSSTAASSLTSFKPKVSSPLAISRSNKIPPPLLPSPSSFKILSASTKDPSSYKTLAVSLKEAERQSTPTSSYRTLAESLKSVSTSTPLIFPPSLKIHSCSYYKSASSFKPLSSPTASSFRIHTSSYFKSRFSVSCSSTSSSAATAGAGATCCKTSPESPKMPFVSHPWTSASFLNVGIIDPIDADPFLEKRNDNATTTTTTCKGFGALLMDSMVKIRPETFSDFDSDSDSEDDANDFDRKGEDLDETDDSSEDEGWRAGYHPAAAANAAGRVDRRLGSVGGYCWLYQDQTHARRKNDNDDTMEVIEKLVLGISALRLEALSNYHHHHRQTESEPSTSTIRSTSGSNRSGDEEVDGDAG